MGGMKYDVQTALVGHLKRQGPSTLAQLSRALGKSSVTVRHHLGRLEQLGAVVDSPRHHPEGPGRPEKVYRLTPLAIPLLPGNDRELATELARQLQTVLPEADASKLFHDSGVRLAGRISQEWPEDPATRRRKALDALEDRGYFPSWEEDTGGKRLQLRSCPYDSAATSCPTLCAFDTGLLCGLMACDVTSERSIARGDPFCAFHLSVDSPSAFRIK